MIESMSVPKAPAACVTRLERRVAIRYAAGVATECQAINPADGELCPGWVRDLSQVGVGLVVSQQYNPGTWLTLELENAQEGVSVKLEARVIHAIEMPNDQWLHGCAFARDLTMDELNNFIE